MIHIFPEISRYTTGDILVEDNLALMTQKTFNDLKDYSLSLPTGVYPNKVWRRGNFWDKSDTTWFLGRYEEDSEGTWWTKWSKIEIVDGPFTSKQALDSLRNQWFMALYTW